MWDRQGDERPLSSALCLFFIDLKREVLLTPYPPLLRVGKCLFLVKLPPLIRGGRGGGLKLSQQVYFIYFAYKIYPASSIQ